MKIDFGVYLREKRMKKGFTVSQLSLYSGVSTAQLSRIENGKRGAPKAENIMKIANALSVPYEEMMEAAGHTIVKRDNDSLIKESKNGYFTEKDELDIAKRMEKMKRDLIEGNSDGEALNYKGEPMSEEAIESLLEALEHAERIATLANKKFAPNRYKDKE